VEARLKFNRRLVRYVLIYLGGAVFLLFNKGTLGTGLAFGFISLLAMLLTPAPVCADHVDAIHSIPSADSELKMAQGVQEALMDLPIPVVPGVDVARYYSAASSVGGDFIFFSSETVDKLIPRESDIQGVVRLVDGHEQYLSVAVGDVAGHGVSAALIMTLTSGILSEASRVSISPADVLMRVNQHLVTHIEHSEIRYVTCMYLTILPKTKRLKYSRAGHPPGFIVRKGQSIDLDKPGVFLGMYQDELYENAELSLESGDRIVIFSDGLIEVRNNNGEEFGLDRLKESIFSYANESATVLAANIKRQVSQFGTAQDDQSLVILDIA